MTIETPRSESVDPQPADQAARPGLSASAPGQSAANGADRPSEADQRVRRDRRRRIRRRALAGGLVVVLIGAGAGYVVWDPFSHQPAKASIDSTALKVGTALVTRGTLTARTSASGTLAYSGTYQMLNHATGTFTTLPRAGTVVHQGDVLYQVNSKPSIFLYGRQPMYRDLKLGTAGRDVRQLNAALVALGYAKRSVLDPTSNKFSWATKVAVMKLQKHLGLTRNGVLTQETVQFLPTDEVRISEVSASSGAAAGAGSPLASGTSTRRLATIAVDVALQSKVKKGDDVTITLPNGRTTPGTVISVGTEAKATTGGGATINVIVRPTRQRDIGPLDKTPVTVSIVTDSVKNVLAVPVTALLALLNGQYGLEAVDAAGAHHLVPVTLGLFDDTAGTVEVTGSGIAAGTQIVVPAS